MSHNWRGNVRELRNVAERFVLGLGRKQDGIAHVIDSEGGTAKPLPEQMDAVEAVFIATALQASNGNIQAAADRSGHSQAHPQRKDAQIRAGAEGLSLNAATGGCPQQGRCHQARSGSNTLDLLVILSTQGLRRALNRADFRR